MNNNDFKSTFSLLNADYVRLNKNWNYRNVISPYYRIYLIDEGYGSLGNSQDGVILEKGYLYLIPSFTICNHQCPEQLGQYYLHILEDSLDGPSLFSGNRKIIKIESQPTDFQYFNRILELNPRRGLFKSDNPRDYEKQPTLNSFQEKNNFISLSAYLETKGLIILLLSRFLFSDHYESSVIRKIPSKVLDAMNYIQTHLQQHITVEKLASRACLNANYFSRIFMLYSGLRPLAYLQTKRIERAQFLIATTQLPLSEIATETGFESLSYFSRIFKNTTGRTPSQYKFFNDIV